MTTVIESAIREQQVTRTNRLATDIRDESILEGGLVVEPRLCKAFPRPRLLAALVDWLAGIRIECRGRPDAGAVLGPFIATSRAGASVETFGTDKSTAGRERQGAWIELRMIGVYHFSETFARKPVRLFSIDTIEKERANQTHLQKRLEHFGSSMALHSILGRVTVLRHWWQFDRSYRPCASGQVPTGATGGLARSLFNGVIIDTWSSDVDEIENAGLGSRSTAVELDALGAPGPRVPPEMLSAVGAADVWTFPSTAANIAPCVEGKSTVGRPQATPVSLRTLRGTITTS